jgi:hypothetical protein
MLALKRWLAGLAGIATLIPSLFFGYRVGQGIYYDYILFPREKVKEHYLAPTRWQDFAFQSIFWTTILFAAICFFSLNSLRIESAQIRS